MKRPRSASCWLESVNPIAARAAPCGWPGQHHRMHPARDRHPEQRQHSHLPYVLPFGVFLALLAISPHLGFLGVWEYPLRVAILTVVVAIWSRDVLDFRVRSPLLTLAVGVAVFIIWIAPEKLIEGYRQHWLFSNPITGPVATSITPEHRSDWIVLLFRSIRAAVLVPIIEELFWRAWLMRWLIRSDFQSVPLGAWTWSSMAITAALFGAEHGPYWEVGVIAGLAYNFLMVRTKSLGDCILAHAVTNGILSAWVISTGDWHLWG
jgi:uncharacterized protein